MFILADATTGEISSITTIPNGAAVEYIGDAPDDFGNTFALGKYTFMNGAIVTTPNWVAPVPPVMPGV